MVSLLINTSIMILLYTTSACADDIDMKFRNGVMLKILREMVNQTKADTLNLPANATSIRENITDTFSCENRTYGYYADVDNECQVFHVCLTSEGASGRNTTYRWSFICPNETIFNQELLTCTRPRDSIDCADAPMFYDVNLEIGKVPNDTQSNSDPGNVEANNTGNVNRYSETVRIKDRRKQTNRKNQNMVIESLMKDVMRGQIKKENLQIMDSEGKVDIPDGNEELIPVVHEVGEAYEVNGEPLENSRLALERSIKRKGRKIRRGSFRFKADV